MKIILFVKQVVKKYYKITFHKNKLNIIIYIVNYKINFYVKKILLFHMLNSFFVNILPLFNLLYYFCYF